MLLRSHKKIEQEKKEKAWARYDQELTLVVHENEKAPARHKAEAAVRVATAEAAHAIENAKRTAAERLKEAYWVAVDAAKSHVQKLKDAKKRLEEAAKLAEEAKKKAAADAAQKKMAKAKGNSEVDFTYTCYNCELGIVRRPLRCSRCQEAHYCSQECQREDWKRHKKECGVDKGPPVRAPKPVDSSPPPLPKIVQYQQDMDGVPVGGQEEELDTEDLGFDMSIFDELLEAAVADITSFADNLLDE
eukprot:gnl/TRDRNA2_/TRDRNA2_152158_c0_seq1.p1 gnl/TRDRNA2_/TRDRNA2_152158_c0~~gnl/TRDRNA2_/TRDRNA2_152158_c0_seq1.p1  ORF type:complete len:246 (+),score=87.09 gnl/TRDRNA2_/TRDRNA2_152158_c0_seq1:588-1325(+)